MKWSISCFYVGHALTEYAYMFEHWASEDTLPLRAGLVGFGPLHRAHLRARYPDDSTATILVGLVRACETSGGKLAKHIERKRRGALRQGVAIVRALRTGFVRLSPPEQAAFRLGALTALLHCPSRVVLREFRRFVRGDSDSPEDRLAHYETLFSAELARLRVSAEMGAEAVVELRSFCRWRQDDYLSCLEKVSRCFESAVGSSPREEETLTVDEEQRTVLSSNGQFLDLRRNPKLWRLLMAFLREPERSLVNLAEELTGYRCVNSYGCIRVQLCRLEEKLKRRFGQRLRIERRHPGLVLETSMKIEFSSPRSRL